MQIESIICPEHIEAKLETKHNVTCREARQVLLGRPRIRFAEKGHTEGENVYVAFGQTWGGRYLSVFFIYKPTTKTAVIISARDMNDRERRTYGRK
ncbi:MAG: BrnT family toxin [Chloroflexi bacterium]|nr:BrnT family toxin [Chloroflexota bacterium]